MSQQYGSHLDEESRFLFCGRRTDRITALYWSGDGYILLYVLSVLPYYGKSLSHELLEAQMPWSSQVQNRYRNAVKIAKE